MSARPGIQTTPREADIAMATELWEALEHVVSNPEPTYRDSEIAVMARVIAAARGIGFARGRERCAQVAAATGDSPPYDPGVMRALIAQRLRECADEE
jgi:hypothetical protein